MQVRGNLVGVGKVERIVIPGRILSAGVGRCRHCGSPLAAQLIEGKVHADAGEPGTRVVAPPELCRAGPHPQERLLDQIISNRRAAYNLEEL